MIKIAVTVRNRLAITKKCIEAVQRHTKNDYSIYIFDNLTNYRFSDHVDYFQSLFQEGQIDYFSFLNEKSTFNAFSKAVSLNFFGHMCQEDPSSETDMIVLLDNDIIVREGWDEIVLASWKKIVQFHIDDVFIVTQHPGGVTVFGEIFLNVDSVSRAFIGYQGGSGFWCLRPDFFDKVGFLDLKMLVNLNKKHDQMYWRKLYHINGGRPYIVSLMAPLAFHCGKIAGSVCNSLTRYNNDTSKIAFREEDNFIESMSFDDFYTYIQNDEELKRW